VHVCYWLVRCCDLLFKLVADDRLRQRRPFTLQGITRIKPLVPFTYCDSHPYPPPPTHTHTGRKLQSYKQCDRFPCGYAEECHRVP
jgi:hypothetical protein